MSDNKRTGAVEADVSRLLGVVNKLVDTVGDIRDVVKQLVEERGALIADVELLLKRVAQLENDMAKERER